MPFFKNSLIIFLLQDRFFFSSFIEIHSGYQDIDRIVPWRRVHTCKSLDFYQYPTMSVRFVAVASSVPCLVLVVPSVEVVVEEDDASRCHASYDAPLVM